jgi:thioredoxin 2
MSTEQGADPGPATDVVACPACGKRNRVPRAAADVDRAPGVAKRYAARSIPTLLLLRAGREIGRQVGAVPAARLRAWVGGVIDGPPGAPGRSR